MKNTTTSFHQVSVISDFLDALPEGAYVDDEIFTTRQGRQYNTGNLSNLDPSTEVSVYGMLCRDPKDAELVDLNQALDEWLKNDDHFKMKITLNSGGTLEYRAPTKDIDKSAISGFIANIAEIMGNTSAKINNARSAAKATPVSEKIETQQSQSVKPRSPR